MSRRFFGVFALSPGKQKLDVNLSLSLSLSVCLSGVYTHTPKLTNADKHTLKARKTEGMASVLELSRFILTDKASLSLSLSLRVH